MKRNAMMVVVIWVGVLLASTVGIVGTPGTVLAQDGGETLVVNGDFAERRARWQVLQSCDSCQMKVQGIGPAGENALTWERTNSGGNGGALSASQVINADVSGYDQLMLTLDVRVDHHSLPNSGWWSDQNNGTGEYPAKISLFFTNATGNAFEWSYGFLINHDGSTTLSNYMLVPALEWTHLQTDVFSPYQWVSATGEPLPEPVMLTSIVIGGSGWDFAGTMTNIQVTGIAAGGGEVEQGDQTGQGAGGADALIGNGDFADMQAQWESANTVENCRVEIVSGDAEHPKMLVWERTNSGGSGGICGMRQVRNVDVSGYDQLMLSLDLRVDYHTLSNSGWWSDQNNGTGEYPAKISLYFTDASGNAFEWSYGFLINHDGSTMLNNYMLVPAGEWTSLQTDVFSPFQWVSAMGDPLPEPVTLASVVIGGSGWDFAGAAANIQVTGISAGGGVDQQGDQTGPDTGSETTGETTGETATGLIVEEHPVVSAAEDTPNHFEFKQRIPAEVFGIRSAWREPSPVDRVADINQVIGAYGYSLVPNSGSDPAYPSYTLMHQGLELVNDITFVHPIAVNSSGTDFLLLADSTAYGVLGISPETTFEWDTSNWIYLAPVFVGDQLVQVQADWDQSKFYVIREDGELLYTVTPTEMFIEPPVHVLAAWQGQWLLEVDGDVIIGGQSLCQQMGYDEIFGWQLIAGQPFYFFVQNGQIGLSYAGQVVQPYTYQDVIHYMCCEPSMYNINGNGTMVWFYALKDGIWNYVEAGVYE
ncbi:MAG: hypothetical protein JXJ20_01680 [Anaerolineae bacterium]|nr:hypothetical protein [Anaerolineae bacterium]